MVNPGDIYRGFCLVRVTQIEELQCRLYELKHIGSGAEVLHIATDDPENLFCLSFQTIPSNSNGVAHVLEHTVLCGSKKFPIKDPFFAMGRRSLNTFMNALTGADFTCYPAASQVSKDFYNLLEVYIDAVFFPTLSELSFMQEGHRLEFAVPEDINSPLMRKGIVFNEMKGALASPSTRLSEALNAALYPDITYGFNSGGDPKNIPELSYQQLCDFHSTYYHPSRCLFFFYGNMPLEAHLDFLGAHLLDNVENRSKLPPIERQKRYTSPVRRKEFYPARPDDSGQQDKVLVALGWLTCHILEQAELLALTVLAMTLADTDAAPLKQALQRSGLCKEVSCYLDSEVSEIPFVLVLKGCNEGQLEAIEHVVRQQLETIYSEGIPKHLVDNALHQLELARCEIGGDSGPFGLSLFFRSVLPKHHGASPEEGLRIHTLFAALRKTLETNPRYLEELLNKYLLQNAHCVSIELVPDNNLEEQEQQRERAALDALHHRLSTADKQHIAAQAKALMDYQKEQDDANLDVLPKVTLEDVPALGKEFPLSEEDVGDVKTFYHTCFTNGMVYADLVFELPDLAEEELPYVRLLTLLLPQLGCAGKGYVAMLELMQNCCAGIDISLALHTQAKNFSQCFPTITVHSHCLSRKADQMFPLMKAIIQSSDFSDVDRIQEVLLKHYTSLDSSINQEGMRYATNLACSALGSSGRISYAWYGLEYFQFVRNLAKNLPTALPALIEKLQSLRDRLFTASKPQLVICCDAAEFSRLKAVQFFQAACWGHSSPEKTAPWQPQYRPNEIVSQARLIGSQVAFSTKACQTVPYCHSAAPALLLATSLMENLILHPKVREQGGAYGAGASSNATAGIFYLYAYRDPHIKSTINAFDEALQRISDGEFDEDELEEAKLEAIQDLDDPVAPGSRAEVAYSWQRQGKTTQMRQNFREALLAVDAAAIQDAVKTYVLKQLKTAPFVTFAGRELIERENLILSAPLPQLNI